MTTNRTEGQDASALERRCHLLLFAYPAEYRRQRAEEMVGTLIATTPADRRWPLRRDIRALVMGGLRARSEQNRYPGTVTSLRLAALLGCAIYLSEVAAAHVSQGGWYQYPLPPVVATAVLWVAALVPFLADRRLVAVIAALAAAANVIDRQVWAEPRGAVLAVLVPLVMLLLLSGGTARPPLLWIWLPGLVIAATVLAQFLGATDPAAFWTQQPLPVVLIAVAGVWILVDARPAAGVAAYCGLQFLTNWTYFGWTDSWFQAPKAPLETAGPWAGGFGPAQSALGQWQWLLVALLLAMLAVWRVRRQEVL